MKATIEKFISSRKIAIAGASPNKDNFGRGLMEELIKHEYTVIPVNPKYEMVEDVPTVATVSDLPTDIEDLLVVVNPEVSLDIARQCIGTGLKRVWLHQGVGRGAYSEEAHALLKENGIEVIHGFCPMMFVGKGFHKFHFWLKKTFGKTPSEYSLN